jgi:hypothetical protein
MTIPRAVHTATLLPNGDVLIAGGCTLDSCETGDSSATAELFTPDTGRFRTTGWMSGPRTGHTATLLADGRVLLAGGWGADRVLATAEIYDPATGSFGPVAAMTGPRAAHTATLLADGRVLLAGGSDGERSLATAEVYDPTTDTFASCGSMFTPRDAFVAALLSDGRVLVAGGDGPGGEVLASAEIFDPATGRFTRTGDMGVARYKHAAVPLADGRVLVAGGSDERDFYGRYASAELYDPAAGRFFATERMAEERYKFDQAVVRLADGRVAVAGDGTRVEVYDPATAAFQVAAGTLPAERMFATATLLPDGEVLILGGYDPAIELTAEAWLYRPID